jgi:hypothetical protein
MSCFLSAGLAACMILKLLPAASSKYVLLFQPSPLESQLLRGLKNRV